MTAALDTERDRSRSRVSSLFPVVWMCHRNLTRFTRLPAILVPLIVMPVFFLVVFTSSFDGITRLDGYPTENLINWVVAFALLQGAMFSGVGTAGTVANDIENGFMDRLLVSPVRRGAIIVAPLTYTAIRALIPLTLVTVLAFAMNADVPGGILGIVLAYTGGIGGALVIGCFGLGVVLRTGDVRAMTIVQMTSFLVIFPSIGQVPIALLDGWMEQVARVNPATNLLRMTRQGYLGDVTWADTWPGLLVIACGIAVFGPWARAELIRRTR
ncbi:MAG: ABC transporter permease [Acidimicrobiaceae bacterium]|nr:ABC transporter permease [Acidimicrobiaceae bacterium]MYG55454.1 ABC transporter permease [Acidimicrobiaceae bacterium]MYJ99327.1 ABC transporter permease [Acidimicrobiaceae bacterium]